MTGQERLVLVRTVVTCASVMMAELHTPLGKNAGSLIIHNDVYIFLLLFFHLGDDCIFRPGSIVALFFVYSF